MRPEAIEETPALLTVGLSKAYGPHAVLDAVTMRICPGEIAVVSGSNGTGKSTLLRCVAGLTPFRGDAEVAGLPVDGHRAVRRMIGYMPQSVQLPENVTVGEAVAPLARLRGPDPEPSELP
jgi:ABC-type multidrug transport system ATPase subunit